MSAETDAFSALDHIVEGDWDRFLLRLRAAINVRIQTDEYKAHIIARTYLSDRSDDADQ